MLKTFVVSITLFVSAHSTLAQTPDTEGGARHAVGLFMKTCVQFTGDPTAVRNFLNEHHVPELNSQGRAIFVRDHVGIGYDASNKVTRLAVVSEDNGACTVFGEKADPSKIPELIEATAKGQGIQIDQNGSKENEGTVSHFYTVTINARHFKLVVITNPLHGTSVQTALTLSP